VVENQSYLQLAMWRSLQVAAPAGEINHEALIYVKTPAALQAAVSAGARHIQITEHLDLTTLETSKIFLIFGLPTILAISNDTWSIRVRSSSSFCAWIIQSCAVHLLLSFACTEAPMMELGLHWVA
jgi:hypothetical protein